MPVLERTNVAKQPGTGKKTSGSKSTLLSLAMVAAAGVISWFGLSGSGDNVPPDFEVTATLPAEQRAMALPSMDEVAAERIQSGLPTRVVVPSVNIDAPVQGVGVVQEGDRAVWQTAWQAVGHHINSALPGNPGNVVLTGHVSVATPSDIAYFRNLDSVSAGDVVEVYSGTTLHRYVVEAVLEVPPDAVRILKSDHRARVTLITCTPDLERRLVVIGSLVV
jgi:sortase A